MHARIAGGRYVVWCVVCVYVCACAPLSGSDYVRKKASLSRSPSLSQREVRPCDAVARAVMECETLALFSRAWRPSEFRHVTKGEG